MKIKNIIEDKEKGEILSTSTQDARLNKLFAAKGDEAYRLLYLWAKQDKVSFEEFKELIKWFMKE